MAAGRRTSKLPLRIRAMTYALCGTCQALKPNLEVASFALAHGADPNGADGEVPTPLNYLCDITSHCHYTHPGLIPIAKLLIDAGVDVNVVSQSYMAPVHFAAHRGDYNFVKLLLDAGADVNLCDPSDRVEKILAHPLMFAELGVVSLLITAGCDLDDLDKHGTDARTLATFYLYGDTLTDALAMIDAAIASRNKSQPGGQNGQ